MSGILLQQIKEKEVFVMKTRVITWQETMPDCLKEAADCLRRGGLVAFTTETVYGLGGDGMRPAVSGKIYAAKGRPSDNPPAATRRQRLPYANTGGGWRPPFHRQSFKNFVPTYFLQSINLHLYYF